MRERNSDTYKKGQKVNKKTLSVTIRFWIGNRAEESSISVKKEDFL